ncbi:MAG: cell division protein ZapA [Lachnospiraceae bacterium]|nr:cell division protein ZapA [Lachnospiraceae bacterium]
MNKQSDAEVMIGGKKYKMSGYEGEEYLQKVAAYINTKINEVSRADGFRGLDNDRKNVLVEINIADDYFKMKKTLEDAVSDSDDKTREIAALKREVIELRSRLENSDTDIKLLREENLNLEKKLVRSETELEEARRRLS